MIHTNWTNYINDLLFHNNFSVFLYLKIFVCLKKVVFLDNLFNEILHTPTLSWADVLLIFDNLLSFSFLFFLFYYIKTNFVCEEVYELFCYNNTQMVFRIWVIIYHQLINHIYPKANPLITLERQKTTEIFFYFLCQSSMYPSWCSYYNDTMCCLMYPNKNRLYPQNFTLFIYKKKSKHFFRNKYHH